MMCSTDQGTCKVLNCLAHPQIRTAGNMPLSIAEAVVHFTAVVSSSTRPVQSQRRKNMESCVPPLCGLAHSSGQLRVHRAQHRRMPVDRRQPRGAHLVHVAQHKRKRHHAYDPPAVRHARRLLFGPRAVAAAAAAAAALGACRWLGLPQAGARPVAAALRAAGDAPARQGTTHLVLYGPHMRRTSHQETGPARACCDHTNEEQQGTVGQHLCGRRLDNLHKLIRA